MESKIKKNEMDIMNLQLKLQFERMKNKIYTQIIQSQTNIKLENIIQECILFVFILKKVNLHIKNESFKYKNENDL